MAKYCLNLWCLLLTPIILQAQDVTPLNDFAAGRAAVRKVENTQAWTNTSIKLVAGDTVAILARGIAAPNGITVPSTIFWVGPEGWGGGTGGPVPNAANYSLIGKIGRTRSPFYVGSSAHFVCNYSDTLFLGTNDFDVSDNLGYYLVHLYFDNDGRRPCCPPPGAVFEQPSQLPVLASLQQNYPNPFNPTTTIEFSLPKSSDATLRIFDLLGREIVTLANEHLHAGTFKTEWDAKNMPSGTYFYRLQAGDFVATKKLLLLR